MPLNREAVPNEHPWECLGACHVGIDGVRRTGGIVLAVGRPPDRRIGWMPWVCEDGGQASMWSGPRRQHAKGQPEELSAASFPAWDRLPSSERSECEAMDAAQLRTIVRESMLASRGVTGIGQVRAKKSLQVHQERAWRGMSRKASDVSLARPSRLRPGEGRQSR